MSADDKDKFLMCAEAVGIVYEEEGQAVVPGPVESVVMEIKELKYAAERWRSVRALCASTAVQLLQDHGHVQDCASLSVEKDECNCVFSCAKNGNVEEFISGILRIAFSRK